MATLDEMRRSLIAAHNSGDTIAARQLALSIKLMESQPMGAVPVAQPLGYRSQAVRRPLTMGERVQEFGAGVGRGLEAQLGGIRAIGERFSQLQQESAQQPGSPLQAMVFRPAAQLGREFVAGLEPYIRDPGRIVEAGQEMAARAASGPQQAGQVFGEMVDPRGLMSALKGPPVERMATDVSEYGMAHRPPGPSSGAPLYDLTGGGQVYPDDVYSPNGLRYYGDTTSRADRESMNVIQTMRGKPDATVTMYRAVPKVSTNAEKLSKLEDQMAAFMRRGKLPSDAFTTDGNKWYDWAAKERDRLKSAPESPEAGINAINPGDWVTISRSYAKDHGESSLRGEYKILSKKVKVRDLYTNGDSLSEFGYWPEGSEPK